MRYAQIFRYVLTLNEAEYQDRWVRPYADAIAQVPGLIRKTWMADFDTGTFASVYIWEAKASMAAIHMAIENISRARGLRFSFSKCQAPTAPTMKAVVR